MFSQHIEKAEIGMKKNFLKIDFFKTQAKAEKLTSLHEGIKSIKN